MLRKTIVVCVCTIIITWFSGYAFVNRYYTLLLQEDQISFDQINRYYGSKFYDKLNYDTPLDILLAVSQESSNSHLANEYYTNYINKHPRDDKTIYRYSLFLTFRIKDYCKAINHLNLFKEIRTDYNGVILLEDYLSLRSCLSEKISAAKGKAEDVRIYKIIRASILFYQQVTNNRELYKPEALEKVDSFLYNLFIEELNSEFNRDRIKELRRDFNRLKSNLLLVN